MDNQSLTTQDNKIDKRVSGTGYNRPPSDKDHWVLNKDTGKYDIDVKLIEQKINDYIKRDEDGHIQGQISVTGFSHAIGTHYMTLSRWRNGYVNDTDIDKGDVEANKKLCEVVCAGVQGVAQYYEENQGKYSSQKDLALLTKLGVIDGKNSPTIINHGSMNLGIFDKWAK